MGVPVFTPGAMLKTATEVEPIWQPDPVNSPAHYTQGEIECIDAIRASMSPEAFRGYLKGQVQKYLWRYEIKGGLEDLRKGQWYLERLCAEIAAIPTKDERDAAAPSHAPRVGCCMMPGE